MTDFENKSKSLVAKTADTVRTIWEAAIAKWKERGIPLPDKPKYGKVEEDYDRYLFYITGFKPCPVCNGEVDRTGCKRFRCHTYLVESKIEKSRWELWLGPLCEHGYYLAECKTCVKVACEKNEEKTCQSQAG